MKKLKKQTTKSKFSTDDLKIYIESIRHRVELDYVSVLRIINRLENLFFILSGILIVFSVSLIVFFILDRNINEKFRTQTDQIQLQQIELNKQFDLQLKSIQTKNSNLKIYIRKIERKIKNENN